MIHNSEPDPSWSFAELTTSQTRYVTHGYHTYPAKFIPQLAARLIEELSKPGEWVLDPFMGSGTTLVEAKVLGRRSVGTDINPVAHLISVAKASAIKPARLDGQVGQLMHELADEQRGQGSLWESERKVEVPEHERIDYWFKPDTKRTLAYILACIEGIADAGVRSFLRCAFSSILKSCSIWLQRSVKPTRDFSKQIPDPVATFRRQVRQMLKRNAAFYDLLSERGHLRVPARPCCEDARRLPVEDGEASLIVTSPPYVTSYEYADLHQLTALWFQHVTDLASFRKRFIGTARHEERPIAMESETGEQIVAGLAKKRQKMATEVATYFTDMREAFDAMFRSLRPGGRACIVIGDTKLLKVDILNAAVFAEQMTGLGFRLERVINRIIPSKTLPQVRDQKTGKFTSTQKADYQAYPHEYILIMQKP